MLLQHRQAAKTVLQHKLALCMASNHSNAHVWYGWGASRSHLLLPGGVRSQMASHILAAGLSAIKRVKGRVDYELLVGGGRSVNRTQSTNCNKVHGKVSCCSKLACGLISRGPALWVLGCLHRSDEI